jgi:acetolactate synthase I/II/III large subunit
MIMNHSDLMRGSIERLKSAKRPVLHVGPDAWRAISDVAELARRLGAPILTTPDAKSLIDEDDPYSAGVFSFGATEYAQRVMRQSDCVIGIGTNWGEFASRSGVALGGKSLIQLIDDPTEVAVTSTPEFVLLGAIPELVREFTKGLDRQERTAPWSSTLRSVARRRPYSRRSRGIPPADGVLAIAEALPERSRLACDVCSAALHLLAIPRLNRQKRLWLQIERSACMGAAVAAGIGLRMATGLPTVILIGDWGLLMSGSSELATIASLGIGQLVVIVWSNAGGALIRDGVAAQRIDVPSDTHTWAIQPRFAAMGKACGLDAVTVRTASSLRRTLSTAMQAPSPVLIDAIVDPHAPSPAMDRYVHLDASRSSE